MEDVNFKHYRSLELAKVLTMLSEQARCEETKNNTLNIKYTSEYNTIKAMLLQVKDAESLLLRYGSPIVNSVKNIEEHIKRTSVHGVLSMGEILDIGRALKITREIKDYHEKIEINTDLDNLFEYLEPNHDLEIRIFKAIESEEKMSDEASSELSSIRRKIRSTQSKIRSILDDMISSSTYQKYLQDPIVSMRDGRYVIPVKQEYRQQVSGVIHGTSSTGSTLFVEPSKVVNANNDISILLGKEEEEIYRILTAFSSEIGQMGENIKWNYKNIIEIDMLFAKAKLGVKMQGVVPDINEDGEINLVEARHPLINQKDVVPININLGIGFDTLMITGPNTGGKTVALKTLGLLTLMAMCGLMIPAKSGSKISVFDKVLADIGEEQSIEQSLSTFSAHITHVIELLKIADYKTLILFDELGAGTDPVEGAALAMAIIEDVRKKGCKVAATTHYAELKIYALETKGVENASCEFDVETLKPTYRLLIGVPGRSNAFAIAKRLGMSDGVINRARGAVDTGKSEFEEVVSSLEIQRQKLEKEHNALLLERRELEHIKSEAEKDIVRNKEINQRKIDKAKQDADSLLMATQRQATRLLSELDGLKKEMKQKKGHSSATSTIRSDVVNILDSMSEKSNEFSGGNEKKYKLPRKLKSGDKVKIMSYNTEGIVLSPPDGKDKVSVQAGIIKTQVDISDLQLMENKKNTLTKKLSLEGNVKIERGESVKPKEIDIRGENLEEGLMAVDQFIDDAFFSKIKTIMIIHGKGTGVLREGIRSHLKRHKSVKNSRPGTFGEGEDGVTVLELK